MNYNLLKNNFRIIIGVLFLILIPIILLFKNSYEIENLIFIILLGLGSIFSFITGIKKIISDNLYKIILGVIFIIGYIVMLILQKNIDLSDIILLGLLIFFTSTSIKKGIYENC